MSHIRVVQSDQPDGQLTIDQLAQSTGVTVRNIRAHQSRGLLPPPLVRGRTGFYGAEHIARLRLITEMQTDGFNLTSIKRILDGMPPGSAGHVLGFEEALRAPWGDEEPEIVSAEELAHQLEGEMADPALARRSAELGVVVPLGDGNFEVASPTLLRASRQLAELGVPLKKRLDIQEQLLKHADGVSRVFVQLFLDKIWQPFYEAGQPEEDWPRVREALDRLRPLATDALVATFHLSMRDAVDVALAKVLEAQAHGPRKRH